MVVSLRSAGVLLLIASQLLEALPVKQSDNNTQFQCHSGMYIRAGWKCDNVPDCDDKSDEQSCAYVHQCDDQFMMCPDGTCIAEMYRCDGEADCLDGHDEKFCDAEPSDETASVGHSEVDYFKTHGECLHPKFQCKIGGACLNNDALCDGIKDCPDGDDEVGCGKVIGNISDVLSPPEKSTCAHGHRKCASDDVCVPSYWICDGTEDCADGSDEQNCEGEDGDVQVNNVLCGRDEYRCEGAIGSCIPLSHTCDGVPQCPGSDDEDKEKCRECRSLQCEHKCHLTTFGGQCYCPAGTKLNNDDRTCSKTDYCQTDEGKMCQHFCISNDVGHSCQCAPGYTLEKDGHTCRADERTGSIFLAVGSEIRTMPLYDAAHSSAAYQTLNTAGSHGNARFIDYNYNDKSIYMSMVPSVRSTDGELAVLINNTVKILRQNIQYIENLAIDHLSGNIYYTQKSPAKQAGIHVCSSDGFYCRRIVTGQPLDPKDPSKKQAYRGLALNPNTAKMAWIEMYNKKARIMIANMDGSNAKVLLDNKLNDPHGIAFDHIKNEIYYSDLGTSVIEKVNIKTGERHVVLTRGVHHPNDIKYFDGTLYWTDWGTESLKSVEISNHHAVAQTVHSFRQFPMGLALNHSIYEIASSSNPCDEIRDSCHWMCVSVPDTRSDIIKATCVCPDNYIYSPEEKRCVPIRGATVEEGDSYVGVAYMEELCQQGTACLNDGKCVKSENSRMYCSCSAPYSGERCESSDPHATPLVRDDGASSGWTVFWLLLAIFVFMVIAFVFLYHKSRRVNEFTRSLLETSDLSSLRPLVDNVRSKLQTLPSRVTGSGPVSSRFSHAQVEESESAEASAHPSVTFNNPMYAENPPRPSTSSESFSTNSNEYDTPYAKTTQ